MWEHADNFALEKTFVGGGGLIRLSGGRLPKRIVFGNLEGAVRRGRSGKENKWTDCIPSDIRAFGKTGDWKATALEAGNQYAECEKTTHPWYPTASDQDPSASTSEKKAWDLGGILGCEEPILSSHYFCHRLFL